MAAGIPGGGAPQPQRRRVFDLSIDTTPTTPSIHDAGNPLNESTIRKTLNLIEQEKKSTYVIKYDKDEKTIDSHFDTMHPGAKVQKKSLVEGSTGAVIILIDNQPTYVLKKIAPRPELFEEKFYQETLYKKLQEKPLADQREKVHSTFILHSFEGFENPYLIEGQREKLAFLLGMSINVPRVQLLLTEEGIFSLHDYVSASTGLTADVMQKIKDDEVSLLSLQQVTIFDMVMANRDRNPGNFLLLKNDLKYQIIPIDHALTLRTSGETHCQSVKLDHFLPLWYREPIMDQPLTQEARAYIHQFDVTKIEEECGQNNIVLDDLAKRELGNNISKLKELLSKTETMTLRELYNQFYGIE